ncbi:DoxX family protein [Paraflavitalea pollutisoli]|uniref:DoxX family protein n=1 Tax=Paraflavitalea pollutisoli TaxID=3034143 RepID=UPI0023EA8AC2|nr:DoxX family protein [Paraflavitalea sp. H1-2-19X]
MKTRTKNTITWILRLLAAVIMLQTLFFKFTAAPESVYIFTTVGMEPWGRITVGILEAIAAILLLVPRTTSIGALLGLGLMSGALFFHFTTLGIAVQGDGGQLFLYAFLVWISCLVLLAFERRGIGLIRKQNRV